MQLLCTARASSSLTRSSPPGARTLHQLSFFSSVCAHSQAAVLSSPAPAAADSAAAAKKQRQTQRQLEQYQAALESWVQIAQREVRSAVLDLGGAPTDRSSQIQHLNQRWVGFCRSASAAHWRSSCRAVVEVVQAQATPRSCRSRPLGSQHCSRSWGRPNSLPSSS